MKPNTYKTRRPPICFLHSNLNGDTGPPLFNHNFLTRKMIRLSTFNAKTSPNLLKKAILSYSFMQDVSIISGEKVDFDAGYVYEAAVNVTDLVSSGFLEFIKLHQGQLTALMKNVDITVDHYVIGIDVSDRLWLNLSKHSYEAFGLEGHPTEKSKDRYLVCVDLKDERLDKTDSKYLKRVQDSFVRLSNRQDQITLQVYLSTERAKIEIEKLFTLQTVLKNNDSFRLESILIPNLPSDFVLNKGDDFGELLELEQWTGLVLNQCLEPIQRTRVDPFISTCTLDESRCSVGNVNVIKISTGVHPEHLLNLMAQTSDILYVVVKGSLNCPVTWDDFPNKSNDIGDTSHGYLLVTNSDDTILYQYSATNITK